MTMTDAEIRERSTLTLLRIIARQEDEIEGLRTTLASTAQVAADAEKREADAVSAERLHSQEWSKSLPTITPAYLREVADGLANQNSHYERVAARYSASFDMLDALKAARTDLMIVAGNADHAARTDPRWEGVGTRLRERNRQIVAALDKANGHS